MQELFWSWEFALVCLMSTVFAGVAHEAFSGTWSEKRGYLKHYVWMLFGLISFIFVNMLVWWIGQHTETTGANTSLADTVSLNLGFIGLVITALTGIAVATAWRAKDQAVEALQNIDEKYKQISKKVLEQQALIEAIELKFRFVSPNFRSEMSIANILVTAFSAENETETYTLLGKIAETQSLQKRFGSLLKSNSGIRTYLEYLIGSSQLERKHRQTLARLIN